MKLAIAGLIGGMVFGLMVSGLANASSYRHERHEYRNVHPRSSVLRHSNHSHHRYERRGVVPFSSHRERHATSPYSSSYRTARPYYKSHDRHERYARGHHGR